MGPPDISRLIIAVPSDILFPLRPGPRPFPVEHGLPFVGYLVDPVIGNVRFGCVEEQLVEACYRVPVQFHCIVGGTAMDVIDVDQ